MAIDDLVAMKNKIMSEAFDVSDNTERKREDTSLRLSNSIVDNSLRVYSHLKASSDSMELFAKVNSVRNVLTDQLTHGNPDLLDPKVYNAYANQITSSMNELSNQHTGLFESDFKDSVTKNSMLIINTLNEARNKQEKQRGIVSSQKFLSAGEHRFADYEEILKNKDGNHAQDILIDGIGLTQANNYINHERFKSAMLSLHDYHSSNADIAAYMLNVIGLPQDEINRYIASANKEKENAFLVTTTRLSEIKNSNPVGYDVSSRIVNVMRQNKHLGIKKATDAVILSIKSNPQNSEPEKRGKINAAMSFQQLASTQIAHNNLDFLRDVGFGTSAGFTHPNPDNKAASALEFSITASQYDPDGKVMLFTSEDINNIKGGNIKIIPYLKELGTTISTYTGKYHNEFTKAYDEVLKTASPIILGSLVTLDDKETLRFISENAIDASGVSLTTRLDQSVEYQIENHYRNSGDLSSPTQHVFGTLFDNASKRSYTLYKTDPMYKKLILYQWSKNYREGQPTGSSVLFDLEQQMGIKQLTINGNTLWTTHNDLTEKKIQDDLMDGYNNLEISDINYTDRENLITNTIPDFKNKDIEALRERYKIEVERRRGIDPTRSLSPQFSPLVDSLVGLPVSDRYTVKQIGLNKFQLYSSLFDRPVLNPITKDIIVKSYGN